MWHKLEDVITLSWARGPPLPLSCSCFGGLFCSPLVISQTATQGRLLFPFWRCLDYASLVEYTTTGWYERKVMISLHLYSPGRPQIDTPRATRRPLSRDWMDFVFGCLSMSRAVSTAFGWRLLFCFTVQGPEGCPLAGRRLRTPFPRPRIIQDCTPTPDWTFLCLGMVHEQLGGTCGKRKLYGGHDRCLV